MGRRTSLASLAGDAVEEVPGTSDLTLLHMPLSKLVPTRFNPRRNFGTDEQLLEFGLVLKKRQLQPAVVVSRTAYLKLWPDEADNVGDATYVIANGERRYRGSKAAGLDKLWVVHREEVANSKADFLDAVLSENNDRENLDPIERALGMETMVKELEGANAVAAHYGKTAGWVSQQRKLLKLVPQLQSLVSSGEMPQREGYRIAGLPAEQQAAEWQAELARRKEEADRRKAEAERRKKKGKPRKETAALPPQRQEEAGKDSGEGDVAPPAAANAGQAVGAAEPASFFSALNSNTPEQATEPASQGEVSFTAVNPDSPAAAESSSDPDHQGNQPELYDQATEGDEGTQGLQGKVESMHVDWLPLEKPEVLARMLQDRMTPSNFEQMVKVAETLI